MGQIPSLGEWLMAFRKLHAKASKAQLSASDGVSYYRGRNELAKLLFGLQQLLLHSGQVPRQWIRIAHPVPVEVGFANVRIQGLTIDLSLGGFGTLLTKEPTLNELVRFTLKLPGAAPLEGQARVVEVKASDVGYRTAFTFQALPEPDRERLELFIFDIVLARVA